MESWSSNVITFNPTSLDESTRCIEGIATAPVYDRTNELITADAIKKALPNYMKLPVVTLLHRDYAVGWTKDAKIMDDGSLFVKIFLKDTPDVDVVWDLIKSGKINAFSISGSRTSTTCSKNRMGSPCITDGINLSTITLCGDDKANQNSTISYIYKTIFGEDMTEEIKTEIDAPVADLEKTIDNKSDMSAILEAVSNLEKTVSGLVEGMTKTTVVESVETKTEDDMLQKTIGDISTSIKELSEKFAGLDTRLSAIEDQKIEKGGIFINSSGEPEAVGNIRIEDYIKNRFVRG